MLTKVASPSLSSLSALALSLSSVSFAYSRDTAPGESSPLPGHFSPASVDEKRVQLSREKICQWKATNDLSRVVLVTKDKDRQPTFTVSRDGVVVTQRTFDQIKAVTTLDPETAARLLFQFSPDMTHIAYREGGMPKPSGWNPNSGTQRWVIDGQAGPTYGSVGPIAWSPDGSHWGYLAWTTWSGPIYEFAYHVDGKVVWQKKLPSKWGGGNTLNSYLANDGSFAFVYDDCTRDIKLNRSGKEASIAASQGGAEISMDHGRFFVVPHAHPGESLLVDGQVMLSASRVEFKIAASGAYVAAGRTYGDNSKYDFVHVSEGGEITRASYGPMPANQEGGPSLSPDGQHWAAPFFDGKNAVLVVDGKEIFSQPGHWKGNVTWSAAGGHTAVTFETPGEGSAAKSVQLVVDGKASEQFSQIGPVAFSNDGKRSAFVGIDYTTKDQTHTLVVDGKALQTLQYVADVAFSPSGATLAWVARNERDKPQRLFINGDSAAEGLQLMPGSLKFPSETVIRALTQEYSGGVPSTYKVEWQIHKP